MMKTMLKGNILTSIGFDGVHIQQLYLVCIVSLPTEMFCFDLVQVTVVAFNVIGTSNDCKGNHLKGGFAAHTFQQA
jgi:hypothetical protein